MTKCNECGIDKEVVAKDLDKLENLIKMLMKALDDKDRMKNWSDTLGDMVKKMDEDKDA